VSFLHMATSQPTKCDLEEEINFLLAIFILVRM